MNKPNGPKLYSFAIILSISAVLSTGSAVHGDQLQLWFYLPTNLLVNENTDKSIELLHRAAKSGYNGVLLADSKFCRWDDLPDRYVNNVKRFREECRKLNIRCFAAVCPIGYSNDMLSRNPNLAEGLPVVGAPFVVKEGELVPEQPSSPILKNGGFEQHRNNKPTDWGFVDEPGEISFIDENVKFEGKCSLRMQEIGPKEPRNGRVMQKLDVEPFRYYHVSVAVKTEEFDSVAAMNIAVLAPDGQSLNHHMPPIKRTQDWKRIDITFNSLDNKTVNLYFGTWGGRHGKVWWDAAAVEPAGFVNVLRRDGTPLNVKSDDGTISYAEGIDFERIVDPKLGNDPYGGCFTAWHETPTVRIPSGSRLKEGERVRVDYYHSTIIYGEQVGCCMSDPATQDFIRWQIGKVHKHLAPDGYFMSHDEIRQGGWDKNCVDSGKTPAEVLADNVAFCVETIRREDPDKPIAVWSDMFDPTHNAREKGLYYLVKGNGPWFGSWDKLPSDVLIMNWNSDSKHRVASFEHFARKGHPQMLAGYYDAEPIDQNIRYWMRDTASEKGLRGAMYTTWRNNYDGLERFAEAAKNEWAEIP